MGWRQISTVGADPKLVRDTPKYLTYRAASDRLVSQICISIQMEKFLKSQLFWLLAALITVVVFVAGINVSRTYRAEMSLLFLIKNESLAQKPERVLGNAEALLRAEAFYDRFAQNSELIDPVEDLPNAKRQDFWNNKIAVKQIRRSTVLRISFFDENQFRAEMAVRQMAMELANALSKYYNLKTEVDVRFIDGPIVYQEARINFPILATISIVLGLLLSALLLTLNDLWLERQAFRQINPKNFFSLAGLERYREEFFDLSRKAPKENNVERTTEINKEPIFTDEPEVLVAAEIPLEKVRMAPLEKKAPEAKKASAPDNLPMAPEGFPTDLFPTKKEEVQLEKNDLFEMPPEPTAEEVKERLNRLLKGDL